MYAPPEETGLLERESELAALDEAIRAASAAEGRLVVVEGAAGIGKTSLLREARERGAARGLRVLTARGSELEQTFPYGVVRQLFERAVARSSPEEREELLAGAAGLAAPLFSADSGGELAAVNQDSAFAVLHGLYWLTANLAEREPLLLAIDDLHWADPASVRWLAYVAHRIEGLPIIAVATARPVELDADAAFADLLADPATLAVRPSPLSREAASTLVAERMSGEPFDEVSSAAHEATRGNPLLLRELLTALGVARDGEDLVAEVKRIAPEVVARRVRLSLAKLGPDASSLARAVAVVGDDAVCSACVPEVAGLDDARATQAAAMLARAELLHHDRPLRFVHPLLRQAVYDAIPPTERGAAHGRAAAVLVEKGAPIERLAAQLLLAPPARLPDTVERLRAAARHSLAAGAAEGAVAYLRRALEEPPPDSARADLLLELAASEGLLGVPEAIDHLREAVPLIGDAGRRAEAHRELARGLFWRLHEDEAVAEIETALSVAPAGDASLRRTLEADYLSAALRVPGLHETALARLDAIQPGEGDDAGEQMLTALKAYATALRGERLDDAVALAERALARGLPTEEAPSWSLWGAVSALLLADRFDFALAVVDQALADARRRGAVYLFSGASVVRASLLLARGALVDAEADARAAVEALPHRGAMIMPLSFGLLAEILVERGQLDEAAAVLEGAGADGSMPESFAFVPLLWSRAMLRLAQGDFRATEADARACGRAFDSVGFRNPSAARWRSLAAVALLAGGDAREARKLADEEVGLARRWGSPRAIGRALRALGLAKGGAPGVALLRESADALESSPALLERGRSLVELGSALRRSGKRIEARRSLRAGAELAQRCGAPPLAERAHEELLAAGAKPRSTALAGVEALTPSERRVAGMAAEGMSNREIAQGLFVTLRTVEMHLSNAFRKLDISSRTQLVEALAEKREGQLIAS
jgi:DNA-binding CsgD family transcriptional regulator